MYVKIEHENSTTGCVQSVILLKCPRKVRIRYQYTEKHSCFKLDSKQLIIFSSFLLKLKQIQCVYFMIQIRIFFSIFFSGRGGVFLSLSKAVRFCVHSIVEIKSGHKTCSLQLWCSLLALQQVLSSACLIQKAQNKISRSFSLLWFWLVFGVFFF